MTEKIRRLLHACVSALIFGVGFLCMFWPWFHFHIFCPCFCQSTNGVTVLSGFEIIQRIEGKPAVIGEYINGVFIRKWEEEWK